MKMENLEQYDEWILKFFSGELSDEEGLGFHEWLSQNEANRKYAAEFYQVWNLSQLKNQADQSDIEKEWLSLRKNINVPQVQIAMADTVATEEEQSSTTPVFVLWKKIAVAVSVLLILVLGIIFLSDNRLKNQEPELVKTDPTPVKNTEQLHHEINNSGKTKSLTLSDGTIVKLYNKSEMLYYENFSTDKRAITLEGRAYFKVAKNPARPFVVTTNMLTTTALGTEFEATAFKNENQIAVKLYEGKVVVSSSTLKTWRKDVYLTPGEEIVYLLDKNLVQVRRFLQRSEEDLVEGEQEMVFDKKGSWYMFNNQSLDQVFEQLEELYSTKIVYSKKDLAKIYFIGKFKKDDSLEVILKQICLVNGLKLTFRGSEYHINK